MVTKFLFCARLKCEEKQSRMLKKSQRTPSQSRSKPISRLDQALGKGWAGSAHFFRAQSCRAKHDSTPFRLCQNVPLLAKARDVALQQGAVAFSLLLG